ncbi:MAG: Mur ligase family protein, partial [Oscillospiraceae bacterium]|nr:Mur ligase family protein [Oscillospiraceae bacterium]
MNYQQAVEFIHSIPWGDKKLGLDRIAKLLEVMGNPQKTLKFIHVAGTNGKGSICEMTTSILESAGYKVGVFVSPFIHRFNERMQINHQPISDTELAEIVTEVKQIAEQLEDIPSVFEMITATAFQYYYNNKCDYVVLEVGMGGLYDATNVIDTPLVAVIATIGFDHMAHLGNTIPAIAFQKAGIIKPHGCVVAYDQSEEALSVFREQASIKEARLMIADFSKIVKLGEDNRFQYFTYM